MMERHTKVDMCVIEMIQKDVLLWLRDSQPNLRCAPLKKIDLQCNTGKIVCKTLDSDTELKLESTFGWTRSRYEFMTTSFLQLHNQQTVKSKGIATCA